MRRSVLPLSIAAATLALAGCSGGSPDTSADATATADTSSSAAVEEHEHTGADHGEEHGGHDDGHEHAGGGQEESGHGGHGDHGASGPAYLLDAADLPTGYAAGHAHESVGDRAAPATSSECAPMEELLGAGDMAAPGRSAVTFSKSHFGPTIEETVIELDGMDASAQALSDVRRASEACRTYVDPTGRYGAERYRVTTLESPAGSPPGVYLRLDALGSDFRGITWDLWAHDCHGMLAAVSHRSAPGGDDDDFWTAVDSAMTEIHG